MRVIKIKVPTRDLLDIGLPDYFPLIETIEIPQIYQYDRTNFFAMHKIHFKEKIDEITESIILDIFHAESVQILERFGNEIFCIIKQRNSSGFWPILLAGSWALLPPIEIDKYAAIFSIIAKEDEQFTAVLQQLKMFKSIEFLATTKLDSLTQNITYPTPRLTSRQRQILQYAQHHGYFEIPKKISTKKIADYFGIGPSAVLNHIQKAEKILMKFHFG